MPVGKPMKYSSEVLEHLSDNIIFNESSKKYRIMIFEFKYQA